MQAFYIAQAYVPMGKHWVQVENLAVSVDREPSIPITKLNLRSRGRHAPGSGDYWNRWVFGNKAVIRYGGTSYYAAFDVECDFGSGSKELHYIKGRSTWDGRRYVHCALFRYSGTPGTPPYYRVVDWVLAYGRLKDWSWIYTKQSNGVHDYPDTDAGREAAERWYDYIGSLRDLPYDQWPHSYEIENYWYREVNTEVLPQDVMFSARPETFEDEIDLGIGAGRTFNHVLADAYVNMVDNLPDMSGMSNAVNAIQLATAGLKAIKGLYTGDVGLTVGSLSDAWLGYRYSYSTTKSDLLEAASYFNRAAELIRSARFRCNGTSSLELGENDFLTARCSMRFDKSLLDGLKSTIERYGLQLDGYALWDLVPFSFVADWFLGIGDSLEFGRKRNFAFRVDPNDCWCSIERRWVNEWGFQEIYYRRWIGSPDVSQASLHRREASGATIVKRAIDVLALLA